jgi:hypothetical protein
MSSGKKQKNQNFDQKKEEKNRSSSQGRQTKAIPLTDEVPGNLSNSGVESTGMEVNVIGV